MNSRVNYKVGLIGKSVEPSDFGLAKSSSDAKCSLFEGVILEISTAKKNLGSEKNKFTYRKPTQVGKSSRLR